MLTAGRGCSKDIIIEVITAEIYTGKTGNIQGEKNDTTPAKNTVVINNSCPIILTSVLITLK